MNDFKCHKCKKILECDCETQGSANQVQCQVMPPFSKGDYVYHDNDEIGQITDVFEKENGGYKYRINYCQNKDISHGTQGGNGPIWRTGFPQAVNKPRDVLFVTALKQKDKIRTLKKQLAEAEGNFSALKIARDLIEA